MNPRSDAPQQQQQQRQGDQQMEGQADRDGQHVEGQGSKRLQPRGSNHPGDETEDPDRGESTYWSKDHLARAVAKLDWNRDGRMDLAISDLAPELIL